MDKREERREKDRIRKQQEIEEFLNDVNILHNNIDSPVMPSISIKKEHDDNYINYHITKYPNCLIYSITMYKKDYPFNIYYSKEFHENNMPTKYIKHFEELKLYFK